MRKSDWVIRFKWAGGAACAQGLLGDVVELVELLGPASCNNVSNLGKPEPPRHDTCGVLEPPEGFGGALRVGVLSGKSQKLSKVIPVIQQRPLRSMGAMLPFRTRTA